MSFNDSLKISILEMIAIELKHANNLKEIELKQKYKDIKIPYKERIHTDDYGDLEL